MEWNNLPLVPDRSERSNFIFGFFKAAYYANPKAERNFSGLSLCFKTHVFKVLEYIS